MKKILTLIFAVILPFAAPAQTVRLEQRGEVSQLILGDSPFIILGGELANSTASSAAYMDGRGIWDTLAQAGLNTVLCPVYWDIIEPREGEFDFSSVDYLLESARSRGLHLVLLWFGSWKNSMSCYVPEWMKKDFGKRFTLAEDEDGTPQEILSAFDRENWKADSRAFAALCAHLKEKDSATGTVLMLQVENEIGMLPCPRDHSKWAEKAWKKSGYSDDIQDQEKFQAKGFARYAENVARAGKAQYDIPMFVNTALNSRGRKPGEYPSGGPLDHLKTIWKEWCPHIDLLCPDIYDPGFADWTARYSAPDNQLFIPEIRPDAANGARALYAFGRHSAIGFSQFDIDNNPGQTAQAYALLRPYLSLLASSQAAGGVRGALVGPDAEEDETLAAGVRFRCHIDGKLSWSPKHSSPREWGEGAVLIIQTAEDEFLLLGTNAYVTMEDEAGSARIGILGATEMAPDGKTELRRLSGDETHQGRHIRFPYGTFGAQKVKIYRYAD